MDKIVIEGGVPLRGRVRASGAKNAALPLLFSTLLADGTHTFRNVPVLQDISSTFDLLKSLNATSELKDHVARVTIHESKNLEAHYDLVRKMRASVLCLGPLLTRYGFARVSLPGGCAIGARPINLHLEALKKMGAEITIHAGYVEARAKRLRGATVNFDTVTVTGTENIMMAAVLAEGTTVLTNCAKEPEVLSLAEYLNAMGAKIRNAGTSKISIQGVSSLKPSAVDIISDRIEAGTLILAGAISGGDIEVEGFDPSSVDALIIKLRESGIDVIALSDGRQGVRVKAHQKWRGCDITTTPFPGFPTDLQAQFMALMCLAEGTSTITETIFENRFMHVQELLRMGADIQLRGQVAIIKGRPHGLSGAPVMATDLRASASLVLAGLGAKGKTTVSRIYHLDRGYERLEEKLKSLGARTSREK